MSWGVINHQLVLYLEDKKIFLARDEILGYEMGSLKVYEENKVNKPSTDIPRLDFTYSGYFCNLTLRIFVPVDSVRKKPYSTIVLEDPEFNEFEMTALPQNGYHILNHRFLSVSEEDIENINLLLKRFSLGVVDYHSLAELYAIDSEYLDFVEDDSRCPSVDTSIDTKSKTGIELYPFQKDGVAWMHSVVSEGVGCVLADEMGLGKTFQVVALLSINKLIGPSVIIAPNSLLDNWEREIHRFDPEMNILIHRGPKRTKTWKVFESFHAVVTSYDTAVNDFSLFTQFQWNLMVLDEAQAIKNYQTKRSRYIRGLPKRAGLAVSGTPFENHITDIWSIYDFCFHGLLGKSIRTFSMLYTDSTHSAKMIEKIISPLLLRRLVSNVKKDLPQKVIIPEALTMSDFEIMQYEEIRRETGTRAGGYTLQSLIRLRQYCALPSIIDPTLDSIPPENISEKFNRLLMILDEIYIKREKVLIFTWFKKAQDEISRSIEMRYCVSAFRLYGETPQIERQQIVDTFSKKDGFGVLIINPTVGGTGLNITAANHVIFYTLEWNPALEDQCIARALRIGQDKKVFIHRLFYANTVEDVINDRLERKRDLARIAVVGIDGTEQADIARALERSPFIGD
jgi:SNF2 family DNA or RNA helicase